ncbi:TPA: hypothetical protein ACGIZ8_001775 [Yersinia enterocolitica]|nr:hypothetical protein [Yersinia enterocolitica]
MGNNNEIRSEQSPTISYDGERLTISPVTYLMATKMLGSFDTSEMYPTFGTETLSVMPTKFDEVIGAFGVSLDYEGALRFLRSDAFLSFLFPVGKGQWKLICIQED